jgi:hypothetical protein
VSRLSPRPLVGVLAFAALIVTAACGGGDEAVDPSFEVEVVVREWSIEPAIESAPAGPVRFSVANRGPAFAHTLRVVRTELAPGELPVVDGQVDEGEVEVVFGLSQFFRGRSGTTTLAAGNYVLICNLPGHYERGMHAAFSVR